MKAVGDAGGALTKDVGGLAKANKQQAGDDDKDGKAASLDDQNDMGLCPYTKVLVKVIFCSVEIEGEQ